MKIKCLSRNPDDFLRETKRDIHKVPRNYDPKLHPFEAPREYVRALNAAKLERVFAKPFLGSLDGHRDSVSVIRKHPTSLSLLLSGAYDGEVRVWNITKRNCVKSVQAHDGLVNGVCGHPNGEYIFSVGADKQIKQWNITVEGDIQDQPKSTILGRSVFQDIDHHGKDNFYATCGAGVNIWDEERTEPIRYFTWGVDSIHHVKFNPVETNILGAAASDRSILLYDMRGSTPLRKVILKLRSNAISWNPMEAFIFTVANEDYNCYTFDMRKLSIPLNVHRDHVAAVMDLDYSPTGKEFVTAGYDHCLRIFKLDQGHSREVYHTKRMHRVHTVCWSLDDKYIMSGSEEMNIRLWKARAWEKLGTLKSRESTALQYNDKLKNKFGNHPQVRRILKHRHVSKMIFHNTREIRKIREAAKKREQNRMENSKIGTVQYTSERESHVIGEKE
ncbi:hypothetical protein SNE40_021929 [Patella caerulea]|uniref:DDB1- and CUL4-associated factor 13 n=1 Tax=Patella caerulea TaxID=87958 RepID=A0AAN8GC83_PATCE